MKYAGKMSHVLSLLGVLLMVGSLIAGCATVPRDNAQVTELKFDGLMGSRYTEILLVFGNVLTQRLHGRCLQHHGPERRQPRRWR